MTRKRHSPAEIAVKLRQADEMTEQGRRHLDIARALGVSVMTYHRWRKVRPGIGSGTPVRSTLVPRPYPADIEDIIRLDRLRDENVRLRRLVADLLLEKVRLEDALCTQSGVGTAIGGRGGKAFRAN